MKVNTLINKEKFALIGDQIYEQKLKGIIEDQHKGKFVAIDVNSEDFEIDAKEINAVDRLNIRHPNSQIWLKRIGSRYVRHFSPRYQKSV